MIIYLQPLAEEDIDNIYNYYKKEKNSLQAANNVVNDILDEIENLPDYLSVVNLQPIYQVRGINFFSIITDQRKNYKIIFFIAKDIINIVTVWDCRQNPVKLKEIMER